MLIGSAGGALKEPSAGWAGGNCYLRSRQAETVHILHFSFCRFVIVILILILIGTNPRFDYEELPIRKKVTCARREFR